jgi:hypothetical protein
VKLLPLKQDLALKIAERVVAFQLLSMVSPKELFKRLGRHRSATPIQQPQSNGDPVAGLDTQSAEHPQGLEIVHDDPEASLEYVMSPFLPTCTCLNCAALLPYTDSMDTEKRHGPQLMVYTGCETFSQTFFLAFEF